MADLEGKIQLQADLAPVNDNPKQWVTSNEYIKGAPQVFATIDDLVAFHPNRMRKGMTAKVMGYPTFNSATEFTLIVDPATLLDANNDSIVTLDDLSLSWEITNQNYVNVNRVEQFSAGQAGGARPTYPYTVGTESQWDAEFNQASSHEWMRFRTDDVDSNADGIYDNWSIPIPIGSAYTTGDYIENRFQRIAVDPNTYTDTVSLVLGKVYILLTDTLTINGDEELEKTIGADGNGDVLLTPSRKFTYKAGVTYTFNDSASVRESLLPPPESIGGVLNNEPAGWSDTVPAGSDQLWKITAQKNVYQQLKSAWRIQRLDESPDLIRFSDSASPHPDTIVDTSTAATQGSQGDTDLINAGWVAAYDDQDFMATRSDLGGGTYSNWVVEKINAESGEYKDRVFKLFDLYLDNDDPLLEAPVGSDPTDQGWTDGPQVEDDASSLINYVSESTKFFDGTLKTNWTKPVPYTGKDTFTDNIRSDSGDNFKKDQDDNITPSEIRLTAELHKGLIKMWELAGVTITYVWKKVYDDGVIVDVDPTDNPVDDFYKLAAAGSYLDDQIVVIKPDAVTGKAVFRCTQTLTTATTTIDFISEYSLVDVTDGKDARTLAVAADKQLIIWDTINTVFNPTEVNIRAYQSNLPTGYAFKWFVGSPGAWTEITGIEAEYSLPSAGRLVITCASLFGGNTNAESFQYAVTTHGTDPDLADYQSTFSDFITISKASSNAVGTAGEPAITTVLDNESHTIVLNANTGLPQSGEVGVGNKATTTLKLYEGITHREYITDYTIAIASDNPNVTFGAPVVNTDDPDNIDDVDIYVATWGANEISAVGTITITFGTKTITKKFSLSTTKDAPGAIILDLDATNGYSWTPNERSNKTITANLYDTAISQSTPQTSGYEYRWTLNNGTAGNLQDWSTDRDVVIARSSVNSQAILKVEARPTGGSVLRSRTVTLFDIVDGKTVRLYSAQVSKPSKPASTIGPSGGGVWTSVPSTVDPKSKWAVDGFERWPITTPSDVGKYDWGDVYQILGETGSQGQQGGFIFYMYKISTSASISVPSSTASPSTMYSNGWRSTIPSRTTAQLETHNVFVTRRAYQGEGLVFDANGLPNTSPVSGSTWVAPTILSPKVVVPDNGNNGTNVEFRFKKSATQPATPTGNDPTLQGWSIAPPTRSAGQIIWATAGTKLDGVLQGLWSTPTQWSGDQGDAGASTGVVGLYGVYQNTKGVAISASGGSDEVSVDTTNVSGTKKWIITLFANDPILAFQDANYPDRHVIWTLQGVVQGQSGRTFIRDGKFYLNYQDYDVSDYSVTIYVSGAFRYFYFKIQNFTPLAFGAEPIGIKVERLSN